MDNAGGCKRHTLGNSCGETPNEVFRVQEGCCEEVQSMLDPFRLTVRLAVVFFTILGYFLAGACESLWYALHRRPDRIGGALGDTLRGMVHALATVFRE